jgi:hypothetical protein
MRITPNEINTAPTTFWGAFVSFNHRIPKIAEKTILTSLAAAT